jgi:hypothetical protein
MCKAKSFIIVAIFLILVLITGTIGIACAPKPAQAPTSPPPITEPATSPSRTPQLPEETPVPPLPVSTKPEIPANYTTYTDESKLFSISYPADWELALSLIAGLEQSAKETINSLKTGVSIEKASMIFFAGRRTATGYEPNIGIAVEPVPAEISTHDQMVEACVKGVRIVLPDYRELSRVKTTVDGREATIVDVEGTPAGGSTKLHYLQMYTLINKTAWAITCTSLTGDFAEWKNDFNTIVRSLRIYE